MGGILTSTELRRAPVLHTIAQAHRVARCVSVAVIVKVREDVDSRIDPIGEPTSPLVEPRLVVGASVLRLAEMEAD
jgi:hypothetical protein